MRNPIPYRRIIALAAAYVVVLQALLLPLTVAAAGPMAEGLCITASADTGVPTKDGKDIKANIGRFGPYIQVDKLFVSIKPEDPHDITLDRALELYEAKLKSEAEKNIADFGDGIRVLNGRFGPYITDGKKNAKIPKDTEPKSITHEQAKKLLDEAPAKKSFRRGSKK